MAINLLSQAAKFGYQIATKKNDAPTRRIVAPTKKNVAPTKRIVAPTKRNVAPTNNEFNFYT